MSGDNVWSSLPDSLKPRHLVNATLNTPASVVAAAAAAANIATCVIKKDTVSSATLPPKTLHSPFVTKVINSTETCALIKGKPYEKQGENLKRVRPLRRRQSNRHCAYRSSAQGIFLPIQLDDGGKKTDLRFDIRENKGDNTSMGFCSVALTMMSYFIMGITFPFSMFFCLKVVQEYERAVIFRLGRLIGGGARGPGIFFILPCIESYSKVDLRTVSFDVPPQEVLTKDSVTVSVDAVVYYRVSNATVSVANVENAHHSTRLLAQTTLRNVLGTKNLSEILSERESISNSMQEILATATYPWGICVERVEIKDVRLPVQLQRAMAAEAEASREAGAKVIAAEGEQKASRALKEASDVISESPTALQLRYLQTLTSISAEKNSTIIFPLPIDFMSHFLFKDATKEHNVF